PRLERAELARLGEQIEVADLRVARVRAELVLEALEDLDRLEREADLGLVRELHADPPRRLARRAAADALALEDDDVARAATRQVIGDRAADHTAADDHRAGAPGQAHGRPMMMAPPPGRKPARGAEPLVSSRHARSHHGLRPHAPLRGDRPGDGRSDA